MKPVQQKILDTFNYLSNIVKLQPDYYEAVMISCLQTPLASDATNFYWLAQYVTGNADRLEYIVSNKTMLSLLAKHLVASHGINGGLMVKDGIVNTQDRLQHYWGNKVRNEMINAGFTENETSIIATLVANFPTSVVKNLAPVNSKSMCAALDSLSSPSISMQRLRKAVELFGGIMMLEINALLFTAERLPNHDGVGGLFGGGKIHHPLGKWWSDGKRWHC